MSCSGKYGTAQSKIQFVIKTVMTNTVEFTEWSELLNHESCYKPIKAPYTYITGFLRDFLNEDVVEKLIRHEALTST